MTVYDSLGTPHQATMYFSRTATPNQWEQRLYVDNQPVTVNGGDAFSTLSFNGNGILDPLTANVSYDDFDAGTGSTPISLDLNFIASTQYGNEFGVNNLYNDGYTTGRMTGIDVDAKGVVSARFTNGQLQQLGKIAVAIFNNPNGLQQLGDTSWAETYTSGGPRLGEAGTSNFGLLQAGALESSNVDLTAQLVEMITAQRNFQANAQMISTSDQVTQTIINMR